MFERVSKRHFAKNNAKNQQFSNWSFDRVESDVAHVELDVAHVESDVFKISISTKTTFEAKYQIYHETCCLSKVMTSFEGNIWKGTFLKTCFERHVSKDRFRKTGFERQVWKDMFRKTGFERHVSKDMFRKTGFERHVSKDRFRKTGFERQVSKDMFPKTGFQRQVSKDMFRKTSFERKHPKVWWILCCCFLWFRGWPTHLACSVAMVLPCHQRCSSNTNFTQPNG